jgi:hypothetical protein
MFPIYLHGPKGATGCSYEEISSQLSNICENRGSGQALAFAFILYDYESPHISKVLADLDYWNALDKLSGKSLTVFSFHVREQKQYSRTTKIWHRLAGRRPDALTKANSALMKYFGQTFEMPALLFFQVLDSKLIGSYLVKLTSKRVEDAFNEITTILKTAVDSISQVTEENRRNAREIFGLIKGDVRSYRIKRKLKSLYQWVSFLRQLH